MVNIRFTFLYRDAGNYKTFGECIFANPDLMPLEEIQKRILESCNANGNFEPIKWELPNIRINVYDPDLDHDWYEFENIEETDKQATAEKTISAFLEIVMLNPLESF